MATFRGLHLTRAPLPDAATHRAWMHAAANLRFSRAVCLRLCWARWYWQIVQGCGPERDLPKGED